MELVQFTVDEFVFVQGGMFVMFYVRKNNL